MSLIRKKVHGQILVKMKKNELRDKLDPDKLNLEKKDLINFCYKCIDDWKKNKVANFKYLVAMELLVQSVKLTPEKVLKDIWFKIIDWFYDLQYKNALAEKESMLKELRKIGTG